MHYIRFLSPPRVQIDRGNILLKAVLTITTDLGETYYPQNTELVATIRASEHDGDIYLRRRIPWKGESGARSVPVVFQLTHQDVEWPACMHVSVPAHSSAKLSGFLPPIVDIWSGPMNPTKGLMSSGHRVERRFLSLSEREVGLLEDAGDSIARHLWDGSQALAQHFDQMISLSTPSMPGLEHLFLSATYRKLHVLELGCGCGTVGISLAQTVPDCDVLLTDLPEVEDLVTANIARMNGAMGAKVSFSPLDWEDSLPRRLQNRANDLIVVSECTYNTDTLQPLVSTLVNLTNRSPKAMIVVATKTRHESEAAFFDLMREQGLVEDGSARIKLPGLPGTGFADAATDIGLHVFRGGGDEALAGGRPGSGRKERRERAELRRGTTG